MTDEQRGREWCERNGRKPDFCQLDSAGNSAWRWVYDDGPTHALPHPLWEALYSTAGVSRFDREAHAYDAVGAALRELEQRAADIRAVLEGGK